VVYDIISQPLYNKDCADVIWKVIKHDINKNIFNISGADSCSLYNFARTVAEEIGVDKHLVEPVPSSFFKSLAPRPKDTSYSNKNIKDILSHNPVGIREGIRAMLKEKQC
jgi:dTDP-4-dehydrorhamnose reductase